jgi:hypothetical protein
MVWVMLLPLGKYVPPVVMLKIGQCLLTRHTKIHHYDICISLEEVAKADKYLCHWLDILGP